MPVVIGQAAYPDHPLDAFTTQTVEAVDALALACEAGNQKVVNVVLLGMLSRHLEFTEEQWQQTIALCVPRKLLPVNIRAFELGRAQLHN